MRNLIILSIVLIKVSFVCFSTFSTNYFIIATFHQNELKYDFFIPTRTLNGTQLQYSCLENPRDGGASWAAIYGVAQSWTWLKRLSSSSSRTLNNTIYYYHWSIANSFSSHQISSVQSLSRVWLFVTPWTAACQASMSITIPGAYSNSHPQSQWCHPIISSSIVWFSSHLQSFPASEFSQMSQLLASSGQRTGVSASNISPSNEYSGLISFRMDWLDLLAVQGTLKSLLQYHSSKASILRCSAFFIVQTLTSIHDYWKNHGYHRWTFVGKVMSLLFNMLSRLVLAFLPRSVF